VWGENLGTDGIFPHRKETKKLAPQVGLEPTTLRLTAGCSAIELLRSVIGRERVSRPSVFKNYHSIPAPLLKTLTTMRSGSIEPENRVMVQSELRFVSGHAFTGCGKSGFAG
jgi:hypothetical protein